MAARFRDRADAGRVLASHLAHYRGDPSVLVLGLPRGGVPVAFEVAKALEAPLDVFVVRKLGVPGHEELAMGAIASGGFRVINDDVVGSYAIPAQAIEQVTARETEELERRERAYRGGRPPPVLEGRTVIVVDDGLATGSTMKAAIAAAQSRGPARVVVAVPTAARSTCKELERLVDEVVCALTPVHFLAVGSWYDDFSQTQDSEIEALLEAAARPE